MKFLIDTDTEKCTKVAESAFQTSNQLEKFKIKILNKVQKKTGWGKLEIQKEIEIAYTETTLGI